MTMKIDAEARKKLEAFATQLVHVIGEGTPLVEMIDDILREAETESAPEWAVADKGTGEVWIGEYDEYGNWIPPKPPEQAEALEAINEFRAYFAEAVLGGPTAEAASAEADYFEGIIRSYIQRAVLNSQPPTSGAGISNSRAVPADWKLPVTVQLVGHGPVIGKGCKLSTLLLALQRAAPRAGDEVGYND